MKRLSAILLALLLCCTLSLAQNISDLVISEVVAENVNGPVDISGEHAPWLEITNTSQGTVNMSGCFLTDDLAEPRKFMFTKGDLGNRLGARQVKVVFPGVPILRGSTLYLLSTDGRTVVDSIDIPAKLPADMAVRKMARDRKHILFETQADAAVPSPGLMNSDGMEESGSERMGRLDPNGGILTLTSVSVVFGALLVLLVIFTLTGNSFSGKYKKTKKTPAAKADDEVAAAIALALDMEQSGEDYAAVAAAVHLYLSECVHDSEPYIITIRRGDSPWNDKSRMFRKKQNRI